MARKKSRKTSFFCRLRLYNGLRTGQFSIKERKTVFTPFKLIICFREMESDPSSSEKCIINPQLVVLLATCIPLRTAYSHEQEMRPFNSEFMTKHNSDCKFIQVSESSIPFLGYMPQDIENGDIFDFYHPSDLEYLKTVYEKVLKERVKIFHSRPYRLRAYNGSYITIETDWSCFVNPWLKKLEFITGKHQLVSGPSQGDVFASPTLVHNKEIEEEIEEKIKRNETISSIRSLLKETFTPTSESSEQSRRRRKELAAFMGTLLEEMAKVETSEFQKSVHSSSTGAASFVIGNLAQAPNELSSNSPPSYNQLNYNENLYRFFNSHPVTLSPNEAAGSPDIGKAEVEALSYEKKPYKLRNNKAKKKESNNLTESGDSGGTSASKEINKNESISGYSGSNSNSVTGSGSRGSGKERSSEDVPTLTEELLYEHNKGMEKKLLSDFKSKKKILVPFIKSVKMPKKNLQKRHKSYTLHKFAMLNGDLKNKQPINDNHSFLEINSSSSSSSSTPERDKPPPNDSLLNSLAIESLLDGLDNNNIPPRLEGAPKGKSGSPHESSIKVEPGSVLESSNIESLQMIAKNSFSGSTSNSSSWFSFLKSPDETVALSCSSEDSLKDEKKDEERTKDSLSDKSNTYQYVIDKYNLEATLKADLAKLRSLEQSTSSNQQFKDVYLSIFKHEQAVRSLLDENSSEEDKEGLGSDIKFSLLNEDDVPFPDN